MPTCSLSEAMRDMSHMFQGMAVRTKNLKIAWVIVLSASILVMDAKYIWLVIIATSLAFLDHPSPIHSEPNRRECRRPHALRALIHARAAAIFPLFGWARFEFLAAMRATAYDRAFEVHRLIIALPRTILRLVGPGGNVFKHFSTYFTSGCLLYPGGECAACARAETERSKSIRRDTHTISALLAIHDLTGRVFHAAL
jgi:hypothetical protein